MKIAQRKTVLLIVIIISLGAVGYLGLKYMHKKMAALEAISDELEAVSSLNISLHEAVSYLNNYVVKGGPEERSRFNDASKEVSRLFEKVAEIEGQAGSLDVSLENARLLYENIENMAGALFKYEAPLTNRGAVETMLEIQQTADWITQFYIKVHELKDREKLEKVVKEAESARKWFGWMQAISVISALAIVLVFCRR